MECVLYNIVFGGMVLDGKYFFYVNLLEVYLKLLKFNYIYDYVKLICQCWFGCVCCLLNIVCVLILIGYYFYMLCEDVLYINIYVGNSMEVLVENGMLCLWVSGNYLWQEQVMIVVELFQLVCYMLVLCLLDWCIQLQIILNGEEVEQDICKGYLYIICEWQEGDMLNLILLMLVCCVYGNLLVCYVVGKVVIQCGLLVYCLEQVDNGELLYNLWLFIDVLFMIFEGKGLFSYKILIQVLGYWYEQSNLEQ